jgi:hypothetical protein
MKIAVMTDVHANLPALRAAPRPRAQFHLSRLSWRAPSGASLTQAGYLKVLQ